MQKASNDEAAQESLRHKQRKAREAAEEERLKNSKLEDPTPEKLFEDMHRVAGDKETNPMGWRFKSLSRQRYRRYGHYDIGIIDRTYGQFNHALEVAGLRDKPGTRRLKAAIASQSRAVHAADWIAETVAPYVREPKPSLEGTELILSISDTHATFLCPFTWYCFLQAAKLLQPDHVYFNGDIIDGSEISRFPKIPGWSIPLQMEFDFQHEMLKQIREILPDAQIWLGRGNHDIDRWASYFTQVSPALSGLRNMRFDKQLGLDDLNINLRMGGTIMSPEGTEEDVSGTNFYGFYRVHHGTALGQMPALQELRDAELSGQSGHVHRASLAFGTTEESRGKSWMSTPMGCTERAYRAYRRGRTTSGWQTGFGLAWLHPSGRVHQYPVITDNGYCRFEGYEFVAPDDLPEPDTSALWLTEWPSLK